MRIRTLQWRFKGFDDLYVDFQWTGPAADYYRRSVRNAYRYARRNGADKHVARHITVDLLIVGREADPHRSVTQS